MIEVDLYAWKQATEGLARGVIGPFTEVHSVEGQDAVREYYDGDEVVMRLRVEGTYSDRPSYENPRTYEVTQDIKTTCSYIYIPTDEEWEAWNAQENEENWDVASARIAEREA